MLDFLLAQLVNDEIEDINENILDQLVETTESVAVFFCSRNAVAFRPAQKKLIKRYRNQRNATSVYYADRTSPTFRLSVSQP